MTKYLCVRELAERLSVSEATAYGLCASRKLRHVRISGGPGRGTIRVSEDDLAEYVRSVTEGPVPPVKAASVDAATKFKHLSV